MNRINPSEWIAYRYNVLRYGSHVTIRPGGPSYVDRPRKQLTERQALNIAICRFLKAVEAYHTEAMKTGKPDLDIVRRGAKRVIAYIQKAHGHKTTIEYKIDVSCAIRSFSIRCGNEHYEATL